VSVTLSLDKPRVYLGVEDVAGVDRNQEADEREVCRGGT
jgi:hypothetical protein